MIWFEQLFLGLITSLLASLPVSVLNTTAAQTAVRNNLKAAFSFTLGVVLIEYFQIVAALYMNKLLQLIPQIELYLSLSCIPLFLVLAYHYWNLSPENHHKSIKAEFFKKGLKISALNAIAIPFWMVYLHLFQVQNWCGYDFYNSHWCILGFCIGTIGALMIYALLGHSLRNWLITFEKWFNKVLSLIFMMLTVVITVKIIFFRD
jgi:threonine/homoserine/homoserine lactone efflux protein